MEETSGARWRAPGVWRRSAAAEGGERRGGAKTAEAASVRGEGRRGGQRWARPRPPQKGRASPGNGRGTRCAQWQVVVGGGQLGTVRKTTTTTRRGHRAGEILGRPPNAHDTTKCKKKSAAGPTAAGAAAAAAAAGRRGRARALPGVENKQQTGPAGGGRFHFRLPRSNQRAGAAMPTTNSTPPSPSTASGGSSAGRSAAGTRAPAPVAPDSVSAVGRVKASSCGSPAPRTGCW